jgi:hypothetical protein
MAGLLIGWVDEWERSRIPVRAAIHRERADTPTGTKYGILGAVSAHGGAAEIPGRAAHQTVGT